MKAENDREGSSKPECHFSITTFTWSVLRCLVTIYG